MASLPTSNMLERYNTLAKIRKKAKTGKPAFRQLS